MRIVIRIGLPYCEHSSSTIGSDHDRMYPLKTIPIDIVFLRDQILLRSFQINQTYTVSIKERCTLLNTIVPQSNKTLINTKLYPNAPQEK